MDVDLHTHLHTHMSKQPNQHKVKKARGKSASIKLVVNFQACNTTGKKESSINLSCSSLCGVRKQTNMGNEYANSIQKDITWELNLATPGELCAILQRRN